MNLWLWYLGTNNHPKHPHFYPLQIVDATLISWNPSTQTWLRKMVPELPVNYPVCPYIWNSYTWNRPPAIGTSTGMVPPLIYLILTYHTIGTSLCTFNNTFYLHQLWTTPDIPRSKNNYMNLWLWYLGTNKHPKHPHFYPFQISDATLISWNPSTQTWLRKMVPEVQTWVSKGQEGMKAAKTKLDTLAHVSHIGLGW